MPKTFKEYMEDKTPEELFEEWKQLDSVINRVECFGIRDLLLFNAISDELYGQGYRVKEGMMELEERDDEYEDEDERE